MKIPVESVVPDAEQQVRRRNPGHGPSLTICQAKAGAEARCAGALTATAL